MMKSKCVSIVLHSDWGEAATFTVEPYFIKFFKQRWYLIGFCREREGVRVYSFDRMDSAELSTEGFKMSPKHTPQVMFNDAYGIINDDTPVENVILKFQRETRKLYPYPFSSPQLGTGIAGRGFDEFPVKTQAYPQFRAGTAFLRFHLTGAGTGIPALGNVQDGK